jgi:hypothetical protein
MNKRILIVLGIGLLVFGIGITIFYLNFNSPREITFEQCTNAGGEAWLVDLDHPDICSACAEYRACEEKNKGASDIGDICPQIAACAECAENNFPYPDKCPDGKEKIGEISDAAIWFQCCK